MNIILITGASSGIGMEFALQMDSYFSNIEEFWLVARSKEKMEELARIMQHKTRIFAMDITCEEQLDTLEKALKDSQACVRMLINCAGYGMMGDFMHQDKKDALGMIRLNCQALTSITHRMIPYMKGGSRIIQMASSAAFLPQPDFAVYAATKSYVLSFSRALGEELKPLGIYVTSVCPGPVNTPFFDIAEQHGTTLAIKKYTMVDADRVVEQALRDSYHRLPLSVCSLPIQGFAVMAKYIPHSIMLWCMRMMKAIQNQES